MDKNKVDGRKIEDVIIEDTKEILEGTSSDTVVEIPNLKSTSYIYIYSSLDRENYSVRSTVKLSRSEFPGSIERTYTVHVSRRKND